MSTIYSNKAEDPDEDLVERVRTNQQKLASELKPYFDIIVCGSGSSGSVVARRLAENPAFYVLLLEARKAFGRRRRPDGLWRLFV
jgi:choline dehydrogenase